jgi:hypothetical protein
MKCALKYATVFVTVFCVFLCSSFLAHWVLIWSGCIWTSSASFGITMVAGLGILFSVLQFISDITQLF